MGVIFLRYKRSCLFCFNPLATSWDRIKSKFLIWIYKAPCDLVPSDISAIISYHSAPRTLLQAHQLFVDCPLMLLKGIFTHCSSLLECSWPGCYLVNFSFFSSLHLPSFIIISCTYLSICQWPQLKCELQRGSCLFAAIVCHCMFPLLFRIQARDSSKEGLINICRIGNSETQI